MSRYAQGTSVSKGRTLGEIERTVMRFGATSFGQATEQRPDGSWVAGVLFARNGITYRVSMALPPPTDREFTHTPVNRDRRSPEKVIALWEQRTMEKWRALAAYVKATLVAVQEGIVSFEQAMLPHMLGPGGQTVSEVYVPQALRAANEGKLPSLDLFGPQLKALPEASEGGPS